MKRYKVLYCKYGIQHCEHFNELGKAMEFAIGKILENYVTKVIDNQTGMEI